MANRSKANRELLWWRAWYERTPDYPIWASFLVAIVVSAVATYGFGLLVLDPSWVVFGFGQLNPFTAAGVAICFMAVTLGVFIFLVRKVYRFMRWTGLKRTFPICPNCEYDMRAHIGGRCPECGTVCPPEDGKSWNSPAR